MRAWPMALSLGLVSLTLATAVLAAGSWVGQAGPVRALMPDRGMASTPMVAPPAVTAGVIHEVRWRYRVPPGEAVMGWLCHPDGCTPVASSAGSNRALAGLPATTPLHFRFALVTGQRAAVQVSDLQIIVNYR